ncbi:MAG: glycoside hydrolase family 3 protein [Spirochaetales bacterium]|nr:glycoside hydrolase family 3 protein [Spirochaetales bacterium]
MEKNLTEQRIEHLLSQLTLEEKISQMVHQAPEIPRLQIREHSWWNEALHGVARGGLATVFPQAIGLGATFDPDLVFRIADATSTEARAKARLFHKKGNFSRYTGLTFWTPNINIFRDPRWGRGQETYGEDPLLTAELGKAFVRGLQGNHPRYLKTAACAKHFAVHSGPEKLRHTFDAVVSPKDLEETYLPAFRALVQDAGVEAVMGAYNRVNGEPACGSKFLLQDTLRGSWRFKGHVVSDCWAIKDFHTNHKVTKSPEESAALAVKTGCDLNCGDTYPALLKAVELGLLTEADIDTSLRRLFTTRFRLGEFDDPNDQPYTSIGPEHICSQAHRDLALEAAEASMVLLKNNGILPLDRTTLSSMYLIGPLTYSVEALIGNYHGQSTRWSTFGEGLVEAAGPGVKVDFRHGALLNQAKGNPIEWALYESREFDVTLACVGLTNLLEGEEGDAIASDSYGDVPSMALPPSQHEFLLKLLDGPKPVIVVVAAGCPLDLSPYYEKAAALIYSWYPGEAGGQALGRLIFGQSDFSGKLPLTFPRSVDDLPAFEEYSMIGRTYRFATREPFFPFGFGLSYRPLAVTSFEIVPDHRAVLVVENPFDAPSKDLVQIYLEGAGLVRELVAFKRLELGPRKTAKLELEIPAERLTTVDSLGRRVPRTGKLTFFAGFSQPDGRSRILGAPDPLAFEIYIQ